MNVNLLRFWLPGIGRLTYDVRLAPVAIVISAADLHLHEGADDAAAVFREMTGPQYLWGGRYSKQSETKSISMLVHCKLRIFFLAPSVKTCN